MKSYEGTTLRLCHEREESRNAIASINSWLEYDSQQMTRTALAVLALSVGLTAVASADKDCTKTGSGKCCTETKFGRCFFVHGRYAIYVENNGIWGIGQNASTRTSRRCGQPIECHRYRELHSNRYIATLGPDCGHQEERTPRLLPHEEKTPHDLLMFPIPAPLALSSASERRPDRPSRAQFKIPCPQHSGLWV
jgi:hypothetical protein